MSDVLYIGEIPDTFCYAVFSSDYITLYDRPSAQNVVLPYYRIYYNAPCFLYSEGNTQFSNYNTQTFQKVNVSNKWYYRKDASNIISCTFIICFSIILLINLFTSIFKKGGLLGGLL